MAIEQSAVSPARRAESAPSLQVSDPGPHHLNRRWCEAFNARDLPRLMQMYEPDAVLVPGPGAEPLSGHTAIEAALQGFLSLDGTLSFVPRFWIVCGELAMGSIEFTMDGGHDNEGDPVELRGVTAEVVRRQSDGSWRYLIDHPFGGAL